LVLYEANRHDYILLKYKEIKPDTTDLDYSLLITKFYNFSKSRFTSEKKLKRIYLSNAGFILTLRLCEPEYRYLLEGYFANLFYFLFL